MSQLNISKKSHENLVYNEQYFIIHLMQKKYKQLQSVKYFKWKKYNLFSSNV